MNTGTIANHGGKAPSPGHLASGEVEALMPEELIENYQDIETAFGSSGYERLTPVFKELGEQYSYDELKLARARLRNF